MTNYLPKYFIDFISNCWIERFSECKLKGSNYLQTYEHQRKTKKTPHSKKEINGTVYSIC